MWDFALVFEVRGDVGATITQYQMCWIWGDGTLFGLPAFGTGCGDPVQIERRIDPHEAFRTRVSGNGLAGGKAVVWKYWGTDDRGNAIYLERALSAHVTRTGLSIVERDASWLDALPYKEWR